MSCYSSNTPVVSQLNGSLVFNFNNHWLLYFQSNVVENSKHIKHIMITLYFWEKIGLTYRQCYNTLYYTFHCNNCITQECAVSTCTLLVSGRPHAVCGVGRGGLGMLGRRQAAPRWSDDPVLWQDGRWWRGRRGRSGFPLRQTLGGGQKRWGGTKNYCNVKISDIS